MRIVARKTGVRRYGFHGISFLITGRVGTHQPYYLTWQEIDRMHASGRWDFESHTANLHQRERVSASGRFGDPLTQLIWIRSKRRLETDAEFRDRVRHDLLASIGIMREHGLPRPALFAYPFSESFGAPPYSASAYANRLIHRLFAAAMTNYLDPAVPVSRREAAGGTISRLEITGADTAATVFRRLAEMTSLPACDVAALSDRRRWQTEGGKAAAIRTAGRRVVFRRSHSRWAYAAFAPGATADWDSYRLTTTVRHLDYLANPSATIIVRLGSRSQLNVRVANHYVEVTVGDIRRGKLVLARGLPATAAHRVSVRVVRARTVLLIDGKLVLRRRAAPGPPSPGGFPLAGLRARRQPALPRRPGVTGPRAAS